MAYTFQCFQQTSESDQFRPDSTNEVNPATSEASTQLRSEAGAVLFVLARARGVDKSGHTVLPQRTNRSQRMALQWPCKESVAGHPQTSGVMQVGDPVIRTLQSVTRLDFSM